MVSDCQLFPFIDSTYVRLHLSHRGLNIQFRDHPSRSQHTMEANWPEAQLNHPRTDTKAPTLSSPFQMLPSSSTTNITPNFVPGNRDYQHTNNWHQLGSQMQTKEAKSSVFFHAELPVPDISFSLYHISCHSPQCRQRFHSSWLQTMVHHHSSSTFFVSTHLHTPSNYFLGWGIHGKMTDVLFHFHFDIGYLLAIRTLPSTVSLRFANYYPALMGFEEILRGSFASSRVLRTYIDTQLNLPIEPCPCCTRH